jgi:hypothetical protein
MDTVPYGACAWHMCLRHRYWQPVSFLLFQLLKLYQAELAHWHVQTVLRRMNARNVEFEVVHVACQCGPVARTVLWRMTCAQCWVWSRPWISVFEIISSGASALTCANCLIEHDMCAMLSLSRPCGLSVRFRRQNHLMAHDMCAMLSLKSPMDSTASGRFQLHQAY